MRDVMHFVADEDEEIYNLKEQSRELEYYPITSTFR